MARRTAAQKKAFANMIAGLKRYKKGRRTRAKSSPLRRSRRKRAAARPRTATKIRLHNPLAVLANPGYRSFVGAVPKRRKRRKGKSTMAKRKRSGKRRARRASPRRRVHRRSRARRTAPVRRRRRRSHARRAARVVYVNGRGRRHGRRRHRRNPGMGGIAKRVFVPYAAGFLVSLGTAVLDASLSNYPAMKQISKVGGAVAIAIFGRKYPIASAAAIGALAGSQGYTLGTKLAGGMIAHTPADAVKGLGDMVQTYPELGALLQGGVGALLQGPEDVDTAAVNYATALNNMAGDGDEY